MGSRANFPVYYPLCPWPVWCPVTLLCYLLLRDIVGSDTRYWMHNTGLNALQKPSILREEVKTVTPFPTQQRSGYHALQETTLGAIISVPKRLLSLRAIIYCILIQGTPLSFSRNQTKPEGDTRNFPPISYIFSKTAKIASRSSSFLQSLSSRIGDHKAMTCISAILKWRMYHHVKEKRGPGCSTDISACSLLCTHVPVLGTHPRNRPEPGPSWGSGGATFQRDSLSRRCGPGHLPPTPPRPTRRSQVRPLRILNSVTARPASLPLIFFSFKVNDFLRYIWPEWDRQVNTVSSDTSPRVAQKWRDLLGEE